MIDGEEGDEEDRRHEDHSIERCSVRGAPWETMVACLAFVDLQRGYGLQDENRHLPWIAKWVGLAGQQTRRFPVMGRTERVVEGHDSVLLRVEISEDFLGVRLAG